MKNDILLLSTLFTLALITAFCGSKDTTRTAANIPSSATASAVSSDSETSMALVADNMDEAITAGSAGDSASDTSSNLFLEYPLSASITQTRTCSEDTTNSSADVEITYSGSQTRTGRNGSTEHTASGRETRVWTNTVSNAAQVCGPLKKYVKIDWTSASAVNGLHLVDETSRTNTLLKTFTKAGKTLTKTFQTTEKGTRTISWATPSDATDTTTVTKTVDSTVTRNSTLTKTDGKIINISATHATLASDPLVITVVRDTAGKILSLTESGTMTITKNNQFYITTNYSKVSLSASASDPCTPTSGTITRNVYDQSTDKTPLKTEVITFTSTGATVTDNTSATDELTSSINHDCAFAN